MGSSEVSDDIGSCLARVRAGDESVAVALVGRLQPLVMKIVQSHRPARQAPEDVAQEVFGRLFERLDRYEARAGIPFEHWVSRLAVRTCLDVLRAERRRPEVSLGELAGEGEEWLDYLAGTAAEPGGGGASEAREVVDRLLSGLGVEDRLVISLLDLEERSVAEVSALTGWTAVGVRVRAFRARGRLRRLALAWREEVCG